MELKSWKELPLGGMITKAGSSKNNKTGSWRSKKPKIDQEKCIKCQRCALICPEKSISLNEAKNIEIDYDYCKGCGLCVDTCPVKAVEWE